jgi:hypothetical protein
VALQTKEAGRRRDPSVGDILVIRGSETSTFFCSWSPPKGKSVGAQDRLLCLRHHGGEVEHRAGEAVELRDDECIGTTPFKFFERCPNPWSLQVFGAETGVLDDLNDLPPAPLGPSRT